jgi:hypothetical protein
MLASCYSSVDGAHKYQLLFELFHLRQEPGQSINDFLARMQFLWNQIDVSDPIWKDPTDAKVQWDPSKLMFMILCTYK